MQSPYPPKSTCIVAPERIEREATALPDHIERLCERLARLDARLHGDRPRPAPPGQTKTETAGGITGAIEAHQHRAAALISQAHSLVDELERFA